MARTSLVVRDSKLQASVQRDQNFVCDRRGNLLLRHACVGPGRRPVTNGRQTVIDISIGGVDGSDGGSEAPIDTRKF